MRHIKVYLNPDIVEFEVEDSASNEEIEKIAWEELCSNINWCWKEVNEE